MRISELAQQTGVAPHTIRFYEREGLLEEVQAPRQENNYRRYLPDAVEYLRLIKRAQSAGFKLSEIRGLMKTWRSGVLALSEKQAIVHEKIRQIDRQIADLEDMKAYLLYKLEVIDEDNSELVVLPYDLRG